ncbi:RNA 2',3'-cyclic phosphodiesterase [Halogeometricum sp. S1BR25-6]|uniref:RNA 2',3'-cyclic phosphodiesterase n=1 Tax=Halogeometricum salsisoli TaxID=2950536 RepID=A0ABU2GB34_9EURY|nr:RNA 2',3'-cyclic phosphodiesterase [Halogeometricum sp. S1BR25-6]MDS0297353.1 RNA 2',3'-cyclic phosphodiesterase [Halogeometricum sp. S1BR25-6]
MRLFLSIDLPDSLTESVASAQQRFAGAEGLRFVAPEQVHVTLKFLGETDEDRLPDVEAAVEDAIADSGVEAFDATVGGFGVFPSLDYISVVWAGVREGAGAAEMTALAEAIDRETAASGFGSEDREFTPHVTLARMDDARGKDLVQRVVREEDPDVGTFPVREVHLKESVLTDGGPRYETLRRFAL